MEKKKYQPSIEEQSQIEPELSWELQIDKAAEEIADAITESLTPNFKRIRALWEKIVELDAAVDKENQKDWNAFKAWLREKEKNYALWKGDLGAEIYVQTRKGKYLK